MTSYLFENDRSFSLEHTRQEYGVYGSSDYRQPAVEILQENGSRICDFQYEGYQIQPGKPRLAGLPATYTEAPEEAETLTLILKDPVTGVRLHLLYTIFAKESSHHKERLFLSRRKRNSSSDQSHESLHGSAG